MTAARIGIAALVLLASCEPNVPHWRHYCAESHTETQITYWPSDNSVGTLGLTPAGAGVHMGGGMHMVYTDVCTRRDSTWVVPGTVQ